MKLRDVFVDTGAWFAVQVVDDANHEAAKRALPIVVDASRTLVTTNLVVGETYTLLRTSRGYREARRFLDKLGQSRKLERLFVTEPVEQQAYDLLHQYSEHAFSYVDATSFAVMRARRIRHAFAFDTHFRTAGFVRIPRDLQLPLAR